MTNNRIRFTRRSIIKTKDIDKAVLEMQQKELESENFKRVSEFLDRHDKRIALDKENMLFEILENGNYDDIREFLNSLSSEEMNSNLYLRIAKKALNVVKFNCSKEIIRLNEDLSFDEEKEIGKLTFDLTEGMEDFAVNKVNLSIDVITKNGKDSLPILDEENIDTYLTYNTIVNTINFMLVRLYNIVFSELASKLSIEMDYIEFKHNANNRKVVIEYHVDEQVSKMFRDEKLKSEALKGSIFTKEQIVKMSLYSFTHHLNKLVLEKQKQKVFPN